MSTTTPEDDIAERPRWARMAGPVLGAGFVAGSLLAVHIRDPHVYGSWGLCPLYYFTGIYCPGCGGMRAANDLTNGELLASLQSNILLVPLLFAAVYILARWGIARWRGSGPTGLWLTPPIVGWLTLTLVLVFGVLRNTPWGTWLTPLSS